MCGRYAVYTIQPHSSEHLPAKAAVRATVDDVSPLHQKSTESGHLASDQVQVLVDNGLLQLNFSTKTGRLESLLNRQAGVAANVTLDISAYLSGRLLHDTVAVLLLLTLLICCRCCCCCCC